MGAYHISNIAYLILSDKCLCSGWGRRQRFSDGIGRLYVGNLSNMKGQLAIRQDTAHPLHNDTM